MKKQYLRLLCALFSLLCVLWLVTACGSQAQSNETTDPPTTTTEVTTAETTAVQEYFSLSGQTYVIRPEGTVSEDMLTAIKLISNAGKALVDGGLTVSEDWYRDELVRNEFEILLGNTNRPESAAAMEGLAYYDYVYEVISPNVVVICGGSDNATMKAVQKFLLDCYSYRTGQGGEHRDIPVGTSYTYRQEYDLTLTLCGKPIENYTIVHKDSALHLAAAKVMQSQISKACGIKLPLITSENYQGGDAILLGMADVNGSHLYRDYGSYSMALCYEKQGEEIRVIVDSTANVNMVAQAFADSVLAGVPNKGTFDIELSAEARIYCTCTDAMYGLSLVTATEETVTDGLSYSKRTYRDKNGKPVVAYVLEADPSKVELLNATPNYGDVIHNAKATTLEAMKSVAAAGYEVLAGVNADFFRINGDYSPQGLCVKQGKVLSSVNSRPWFGITKDGRAVVGTAPDYSQYAGKLQEAVGGSAVLLRNGLVENVGYLSDSKSDRHPRTVAGVKADGTLLLIAVDGRQTNLSNGASLSDLAWILLELGATDAVNLDGGGSTTIITCNEAGKYSVRNSPSDGSLRKVYNSVVVVRKKES